MVSAKFLPRSLRTRIIKKRPHFGGAFFSKGAGVGLFRGGVKLGDFIPIHHVPDGLKVVRAAILVVEVVGVLPDINAKDGFVAVHQGAVLVGGGYDGERTAAIHNQPCPAAAETRGTRFFHRLFEAVQGAEGVVDRGSESTGGFFGPAGGENVPKQSVVGVTTSIVAHGGTNAFRNRAEIGDERFDAFGCEIIVAFQGLVQIGDISGVVFAMVDFHGLGIDVGFECIFSVGQFGKSMGHDQISLLGWFEMRRDYRLGSAKTTRIPGPVQAAGYAGYQKACQNTSRH